jgi:hypothetical protein
MRRLRQKGNAERTTQAAGAAGVLPLADQMPDHLGGHRQIPHHLGVVTALFQTDTGARLIGLPHGSPVSSWVPILMFTVLFGLSMDYEVFLLSPVR